MSKFGNFALSVCITGAALVGITATAAPGTVIAAGTGTVSMAAWTGSRGHGVRDERRGRQYRLVVTALVPLGLGRPPSGGTPPPEEGTGVTATAIAELPTTRSPAAVHQLPAAPGHLRMGPSMSYGKWQTGVLCSDRCGSCQEPYGWTSRHPRR